MTESIDETVQDQGKLSFTNSDIQTFRMLIDLVDTLQWKTKPLIVSNKNFPLKKMTDPKKSSEFGSRETNLTIRHAASR